MAAKKKTKTKSDSSIAINKKAKREYEFLEKFEAGMVLKGSEVKSLRQGGVSFKDAHVRFIHGEAWLMGLHIAEYDHAGYTTHEPDRPRKLLLHHGEIVNLKAKVEQKGLSVIPYRIYLKRGRMKVEIVLGRGKKLHDRRNDLKERDIKRDMQRQLAKY